MRALNTWKSCREIGSREMQNFPPLTMELAERIERSVPQGKIANYEVEVGRFGQTVVLRGATPGRGWLNGVYCFGADDLGRLKEILDFYGTDGTNPPTFYVAPMR